MPSSISAYLRVAREPRYSLTFAFPLLLLYEVLALALSRHQFAGVRNGADVLLKSLFVALGGRNGLIVFGALLVGAGGWLVWRDWRGRRVDPKVFAAMGLESVVYAFVFGMVASTLTTLLLPGLAIYGPVSTLVLESDAQWNLLTQLMISLGAGIYEELLFRVLLVSGLAWLMSRIFRWRPTAAAVLAVITGALIFSAFHYVGPYGDNLALASFTFRTVAGVLFSALYLLRGFGITAWTHALYDVFLALR
jgi:membrane protease YdiL (CAAX protease family)